MWGDWWQNRWILNGQSICHGWWCIYSKSIEWCSLNMENQNRIFEVWNESMHQIQNISFVDIFSASYLLDCSVTFTGRQCWYLSLQQELLKFLSIIWERFLNQTTKFMQFLDLSHGHHLNMGMSWGKKFLPKKWSLLRMITKSWVIPRGSHKSLQLVKAQ